ncbi:riboflavin synthase [Candidatus Margulisiibacteriota bacterium]
MFTGIIQELGSILSVKSLSEGLEITSKAPDILSELKLGDSIAINGICSTVAALGKNCFSVQYLKETVKKTNASALTVGDKVNLELSLTPSSRMGGHFVTGHVDQCAKITNFESKGPWKVLTVSYSEEFRKYLVPKGSICIDGISLTIVDVSDSSFTCHLIPHTIKNTTLSIKKRHDPVNLEFDILAKYQYNFYFLNKKNNRPTQSNLKESLLKAGYLNDKI